MWTEEQLQQLKDAGIAFVSMSALSNTEDMMDAFQLIGDILGEEESERAEAFNAYYQGLLDDAEKRTADLSDDEKVGVLKLNVSGGAYTTVNKTDIFNNIVSSAGGVNLAADYEAAGGARSGLNVDAEQIIDWNPAVIITNNQDSTDTILNDAALQDVDAVKNGAVYTSPKGIYLWGVRSAENAMMTPWLGQKLYPDLFSDVDMNQVVEDFYQNWYNTEIGDEDAERILAGQ